MTSHEPEVPGGGTAGKIEALPFDTAWRTRPGCMTTSSADASPKHTNGVG